MKKLLSKKAKTAPSNTTTFASLVFYNSIDYKTNFQDFFSD